MTQAQEGAPHRILLIDDSRDDAELAEIALRDAGLAIESMRVWSREDLARALAEFRPQLVLSDLNLPGFSGEEALAQVRARAPDLPFVFLTGAEPENTANVPAADGLVSKDDPASLAPLVRRLLPGG